MSKTTKRVLSAVLTVLMVVSMLSTFSVTFAATPAFSDAYTCAVTDDSGNPVIGRDALLVDNSIAADAVKGSTHTQKWDGANYTFTVGVNAFKHIEEAQDYAVDNGIATPDILLYSQSTVSGRGWNLMVYTSCNIYARNWNTLPFIRDTQDGEWSAVKSNGADWEENAAYTSNATNVNNIIVDGAVTGEVGVYGVSIIDRLYLNGISGGLKAADGTAVCANARTDSTGTVNITFGNVLMNVSTGSLSDDVCVFMTNNSAYWGNTSADCKDTLTFKDTYFKALRKANKTSRLFPDAALMPNVVFDGCYIDGSTSNLKGPSQFKQHYNYKNTTITWKNCNIRNIAGDPTAYINFAYGRAGGASNALQSGYTSTATFDNNVFYNVKTANSAVIVSHGTAYTGMEFTDNFVYLPTAFTGFRLFGSTSAAGSWQKATVTGNKLLAFDYATPVNIFQGESNSATTTVKECVENNYWAPYNNKTLDEWKTIAGQAIPLVRGNLGSGAYYVDFDMTMSTADLALTDVKFGANDTATVKDDVITVDAKRSSTAITPEFIAKNTKATAKVSTKSDFSDSVSTIDVSKNGSKTTYYVKVYYPGYEDAYKTYTMQVFVEASEYDRAFDGVNTYIINKDWTDAQLAGSDDLTIYFRGEEKVVNPKTYKLFNSYEDAYAVAFATSNWNADNYLTRNPVFIFGPGDYSGSRVHLPAPATVYGANAGISPNADVDSDDWSISGVKANSGWAANPNYNTDKETILNVVVSQRLDDGSGKWETNTSANNFFAYLKEKSHAQTEDAVCTYVIDGFKQTNKIFYTGVDANATVTYGGDSIKAVKWKKTHVQLKNVRNFVTTNLIGAWNGTREYVIFTYDGLRNEQNISQIGERYIKELHIKNSYFTKLTTSDVFTRGLWTNGDKVWSTKAADLNDERMTTGKVVIEDSIIYNCIGSSGPISIFNLNADSMADVLKNFSFTIDDSILYNAGDANWGTFRWFNHSIYKDKEKPISTVTDRNITLNLTDNIFYNDVNSKYALIEGNEQFVTAGKTTFNVTGNRFVNSHTYGVPNTNYTVEEANKLFSYNFSDNYWSTTEGGMGKPYTFNIIGRPSGDPADLEWEWDYMDSNYYYDWDMQYDSHGLAITGVDVGEGNSCKQDYDVFRVNVLSKTGGLNAASFKTAEGNVVTIKNPAGTAVDAISYADVDGTATYTVEVRYANGMGPRTYTVILHEGAVNFNEALKTGIKFGDKTFTADNTVAFAPSGQTFTIIDNQKVFYQYFDGILYEYVVDNENVFEYSSKDITWTQINSENTQARKSLNFDLVKDKAENGNVILAGENFMPANYQLVIPYATSIYGLNAGIDPVDKTNATADYDYKAELNSEWGKHGDTKLYCVRVGNVESGTVHLEGVTFTDRVNDVVRYKTYDSKEDAFTFSVKNVVVNGNQSGGVIFNLTNPLSLNGETSGNGESTGYLELTEENKKFGAEIYNDSFILENCFHLKGPSNHLLNEVNPANVTVKNYYCDVAQSGRVRELMAFFKNSAYNKTQNITITDSIVRNGGKYGRVFHFEGIRNNYTTVADDSYNFNVVVDNNIIFKAGTENFVTIKKQHYNSVKITDNTVVAVNDTVKFGSHYDTDWPVADKYALEDNLIVSGNKFVGFTDAQMNIATFALNDYTPVYADGFVTDDDTAYKYPNANTGDYVSAMGDSDYYANFGMTAKHSDFDIVKFEAGTSGVSDIKLDENALTIEMSLARGTTEGMDIVLSNDQATCFWSTDAAGENVVENISREDLKQLVTTYYFHIVVNGVVTTYTVDVLNDVVEVFAEVEDFDKAYFSNKAVIITDKAANHTTGDEIIEEWDGAYYRFTVGVNAFAKVGAISSDAETVEVLLPRYTGEDGGDDLVIKRSMKVYTPNYKTPALLTDGFGNSSPTQGKAWGLNPEFVEKMDLVRIKTVSIQNHKGDIEIYGLTVDYGVYDRYRSVGNTGDITLVNTYFTCTKAIYDNSFLFSFSINKKNNNVDSNGSDNVLGNENNTDTLYVKNAYFSPEVYNNNRFRLIGENEMSVAHTIFEEIYLDAGDTSGWGGNGNWLKTTAKDSSFTIKNSYLANWTEFDFQFKGYCNLSGNSVAIPEGYRNKLEFSNNILVNFAGHNDIKNNRSSVIKYNSQGFSDFVFTNNYVKPVYRSSIRCLFWDTAAVSKTEADYTITGNVFNGLAGGITCASGNAQPANWNWNVSDNFVITEPVSDLSTAVGREYSANGSYKTMKYDWYRLSADGTLKSCDIQDMTWSQRVALAGSQALVNIYEGDDLVTIPTEANADGKWVYDFDLSSLVKENKYGNTITVKYGDGEAVDLEADVLSVALDSKLEQDTGIKVTVTVDSPDTKAEAEVYTFVLFLTAGNAPAFKGSFTDDAKIIKDTALIVTNSATGTQTINVQWQGETYSFVSGTNAFATVADAIAYAKANTLADAQILLADSTATTDIVVTYPCKIYAENYNTAPYTNDGYGLESASHGANWAENPEYFENETKIHSVAIDGTFPGGAFELHGVTMTGLFLDSWRSKNADIVVKNITIDNVNLTAPSGYKLEGAGGGQRYTFRLDNPANRASVNNTFDLINTYVKKLNGDLTPFMGEPIMGTTVIDGMYMNLDTCNYKEGAPAYLKARTDGASFTIKNCNFYSSTLKQLVLVTQIGGFNCTGSVTYSNNIFNNVCAAKDSVGNPYYINTSSAAKGGNLPLTVENNYFAADSDAAELFIYCQSREEDTPILDTPIFLKNNVFNGSQGDISYGIGGNTFGTGVITVQGNYAVPDYIAGIENANVVGSEIAVNPNNVAGDNYYALDYDRTIMSNVVYDYTLNNNKVNILTNGTDITYAYDELVTKAESGDVTVDLSGFVNLDKYNTAVLVLSDGTEKDISTVFTYDSNTLGETVTLKVYSYDKTVSDTQWTITFAEPAHSYGEWQTYIPANCTDAEVQIRYCDGTACTVDGALCDHSETQDYGEKLGHELATEGVSNNDGKCNENGTMTVMCTREGCKHTEDVEEPDSKVSYHKYTEYTVNTEGNCSIDGTLIANCDWCGANPSVITNEEDLKTAAHNVEDHTYGEWVSNEDATCLADGTHTHYCINEDASGAVVCESSETETEADTKLDHDFSTYVYNNDATCQNNGTQTATCSGVAEENGVITECGATDTIEAPDTKLAECEFLDEDYVLTTAATCTTPGYETASCRYESDGCTATHTRLNADRYPINPDNHDYAKPVYQEDATCSADGTQTQKCKREGCGHILTTTAEGTKGQGTHVWGEFVANNDATCASDGTMTRTCTNEGCTVTETVTNPDDPASKQVHTWGEYTYNNDATCVKDGTKTAYCTVCGADDVEKDRAHLKSTVAHTYGDWKSNGDATCTKDGTKTRECTVDRCYHSETVADKGSMKAHTWGKYTYNKDATYFEDGTKTAKCTGCDATKTVAAKGTKLQPKKIIDTSSKFIDVNKGDWYKNAVDYAVSYGLISGTTDTTFEPNTVITRGMFVSILARMAGVDTSNNKVKTQFKDVESGRYYTAAIKWAAELEIVSGVSATEFAPGASITRQQLAKMLFNYARAYGIELKGNNNVKFADAASISNYAKEAVAACAKAGIISGYTDGGKTYFKPGNTATRAEAVQMIYKFHSEYITGTAK